MKAVSEMAKVSAFMLGESKLRMLFGQCEVKVPVRQLTGDVTLMTVDTHQKAQLRGQTVEAEVF